MEHAKCSSGSGSSKAQTLLNRSAHCLSRRDFSTCRKLALQARESDPYNSASDQILAVADILLAANRQNPPDWYSVLQIPRPGPANPTLIRTQFEKLRTLLLLKPGKNRFAFSQEALWLIKKAWSVLSDPEKKTHFENGSEEGKESGKQREEREEIVGNGKNGRGYNGGKTFWTLCPYCYYMFEYEKVYADCCLRCQNCRKGFHGVAIKPPSGDVIVEGKEQYNFCFGYFQMGYMDPNSKMESEVVDKKDENVVVISDDDSDEDDFGDGNVGFEGMHEEVVRSGSHGAEGKTPVKRVKIPAGRIKSTKSKSVARNTKKIMGNGMRSRRIELEDVERVKCEDMEVEEGNGVAEGEGGSGSGGTGGLEFFEGEDDIFVGIGDGPI
ncbi:hypothetical protein D8674_013407 [Pyrus ussuriensis x Pyrus communis]|uniref:J domain-containing protein n=1 Tax=Pyrus ussuriensis x Pyrus communis TaxID=2448454 RepID=A0A5N5GQJ7_9ROSA|nr:hypothetical protein D8674_013407 [Pyrus ussuriensis x Pyrus communis]